VTDGCISRHMSGAPFVPTTYCTAPGIDRELDSGHDGQPSAFRRRVACSRAAMIRAIYPRPSSAGTACGLRAARAERDRRGAGSAGSPPAEREN
jgi:hypothetical protein